MECRYLLRLLDPTVVQHILSPIKKDGRIKGLLEIRILKNFSRFISLNLKLVVHENEVDSVSGELDTSGSCSFLFPGLESLLSPVVDVVLSGGRRPTLFVLSAPVHLQPCIPQSCQFRYQSVMWLTRMSIEVPCNKEAIGCKLELNCFSYNFPQ